MVGSSTLTGEAWNRPSKQWIVDSGSTSHLCLNKSEFTSYKKYDSPCHIWVGNTRTIPSLGEGTVSVTCIINNQPVTHHIRCRQDNNPPHESFVESDSRARMSYHNHPKSCLHSIT